MSSNLLSTMFNASDAGPNVRTFQHFEAIIYTPDDVELEKVVIYDRNQVSSNHHEFVQY
jgi:hypothetical protein